jgi:preprotein translocase subunit SecA
LEAYGQRDPLVQYKSKASELFQNLLKDMRSGVISRMFTYRPRIATPTQSEVRKPMPEEIEEEIPAEGDGSEPAVEAVDEEEAELPVAESANQPQLSKSQKRRRHRK